MVDYEPSKLVLEWKERYLHRWATDFHIEMLLQLNIIKQVDADFIKGISVQ